MIQKLKLSRFRNFFEEEFSFSPGTNLIIAPNGKGKTNILESLCLSDHAFQERDMNALLHEQENILHISYFCDTGVLWFAYDKESHQKKFYCAGKSTTRGKFREYYPQIVSFHPLFLNIMYFWPSARRDFLDEILIKAYPEYEKKLRNYKKILSHRNKLLKNIFERKSQESELQFWNESFIESACDIYRFRKKIISFLEQETPKLKEYFFGKIQTLSFVFHSKIHIDSPEKGLREYIEREQSKEILLRKTLRGPHLDDFDILVNTQPLIQYASRGEVKSILLWLKYIETQFLESTQENKEILFLVDDILSELDKAHSELLFQTLGKRQSIITSIYDCNISAHKIYL